MPVFLEKLLAGAAHHFAPAVFEGDGLRFLTPRGVRLLLAAHGLSCEEADLWRAAMAWSRRREEVEADRERRAIAAVRAELEKELAKRKKDGKAKAEEEIDKKDPRLEPKVSFKSVAAELLGLVRYPFIPPEVLNNEVSCEPEFLRAGPVDSRRVPCVLRAAFHQNGQRGKESDWLAKLGWRARKGSTHFNGEWEWRYGPGALRPPPVPVSTVEGGAAELPSASAPKCREWGSHPGPSPVWEAFEKRDLCWFTDSKLEGASLGRVEVLFVGCDACPDLDAVVAFFNTRPPPLPRPPPPSTRTLEVEVVSSSNLPKTDMFGSCDPFCMLRMGDKAEKTRTINNSLSPEWNESFRFTLAPGVAAGELSVRIMDWDRFKDAEMVGECVIPAREMDELWRLAPGGLSVDRDYWLLGLDGGPLLNRQRQGASVRLSFRVPAPPAPPPGPSGAGKPAAAGEKAAAPVAKGSGLVAAGRIRPCTEIEVDGDPLLRGRAFAIYRTAAEATEVRDKHNKSPFQRLVQPTEEEVKAAKASGKDATPKWQPDQVFREMLITIPFPSSK